MKSCYYTNGLGKLHYLDSGLADGETIVFLHGFTGSSRDFLVIPDFITSRYRCLVPDLPGHGQTQVLENEAVFNTAGQVSLLKQWLNSIGQRKFHLFGYSMGGRLAIQFAVQNSHLLQSLILVSTTAGITEETSRLNRAKADMQLVQRLENSTPTDFLLSWLAQPLFQGITNKGKDFAIAEVMRRLPIQSSGLASSLKYFSSGVMPAVWHQLHTIKTLTLVIAGCKDQKYLDLGHQLINLMPNSVLEVLETGHSPLIESPDLLWEQIAKFLKWSYQC
ncbi:MAG: alpha/beta fold hydrolase [Calothrix sp. MO_192.B10]|nr:alpha/beta fold hydrolase [Calothrix sp. MO_192.B10]